MQGKKRQMEYVYHLSYKQILSFLSGQTHKKEKKISSELTDKDIWVCQLSRAAMTIRKYVL
jgi:hypothetical protein